MKVAWSRCSSSLSSPLLLSLPSSSCAGVRGSARAALRARTLSPNTITVLVSLVACLFFPRLAFLRVPLFFCVFGMAVVCGSPCVRVFGGHDGNRESVSFVLVFLVVACSSFPVPSVAASAVAFGA